MLGPEELEELRKDIVLSHTEPGNSEVQTRVLMKCIQVLSLDDLPEDTHLFCNKDLQPISGHTLIMFSFPGQKNKQSRIVEQKMVTSMMRCNDCVRSFWRCLSQMRQRFVLLRKIPVAQVQQFMNIIIAWQTQRIAQDLEEILKAPPNTPDSLNKLLYDALSIPSMVRKDSAMRPEIERLIDMVADDSTVSQHLLPAVVTYLVEGNLKEYAFAEKILAKIPLENRTLDPQVIDEFNYHFYRIQNAKYFTPDLSCRFWNMLKLLLDHFPATEITRLLKPSDLEEMSSFTRVRLFPLIRVLFNNLMALLEAPLPVLLKVLQKFLEVYDVRFWQLAPDCHYSNILDTVLPNAHFQAYLHEAAVKSDAKTSLSDLLAWMSPLVDSLSGSQKQSAAIKLCDFLVQREKMEKSNDRFDSVNILTQCFTFDQLNPLETSKQSETSINLMRMRDARLTVSSHAEYFITLAKKDVDVMSAALNLICCALRYDILVAANNSAVIQHSEIPALPDFAPKLWEELTRFSFTKSYLVSKILESFTDALSIIIFKEKKSDQGSKELNASIKIHNRECEKLSAQISSVLDKISLADPDELKSIINEKECLVALWSCLLSPSINQSALNVIYQVYDAEGRYEAIESIFGHALKPNINAVVTSLSHIAELKVYETCPKTMRILMDVIRALMNPLTGILTTQAEKANDCKDELKSLWKASWSFLVMVYQQTLIWAGLYHLEDLIEFTRDTLDTSHLLLDSFRVLLDIFNDPSVAAPLFNVFMEAFHFLIVWLRLGDTSLLNSCVDIVFKGFDFAKELNVNVDKSFLIMFAKYGAKAKKFNNKLTEQQRNEILAKASEFDAPLVQYVIDEVARERAGKMNASLALTKSQSPSISPGATYAYQSKPKQPKQLTLSRFGVITSTPPVAPPPPKPFKSNNLEAIRNELKSNRTPSKVPVINPAPPRPAGFNPKHAPVVGRSLNALRHKKVESDSSDDDENDEDVDISDLFLDSKKKTKITELDIHGRPVVKMAAQKKIDNKRQEEERMRLRLNVNLKPLYSTILRWNYNSNSEFPTDERDIYQPIKNTYTSAKEYVSMIEPLLMLECWQGIQSSRVTGQETPFDLLVGSRTTCDGFFDVYASIKKTDLATRKIGDTDLLVLGYVADKNMNDPRSISSYLKNPTSQTCLAKVKEIKSANADFSDLTIRVYPQGSMMGILTPKSVIVAMKVMPMITVEREYSSLKGLPYYDLCDDILKARPASPANISESEATSMCQKLNVNKSQAKAILGSFQNDGFSLIQGPPGTGKTKTILGIVGNTLSHSKKSNVIEVPGLTSSDHHSDKEQGPKVLICAPSNAAVDELVVRLRQGVHNAKGEEMIPKIVRLGRSDAINSSVRDLGLEEQIEKQLKVRNISVVIDPNIRTEHNKCIAERDEIREKLRRGDLDDEKIAALETQLREINKKRSELGKRLDEQRENASIAYRTKEIEKRQLQAKILSEAQVICSTLSGSAHDFLASMSMKFDQVIIDEACQCVELSAIIPLRYGCKKCIMVGDPNQLPPTVLSQKAASFKYEESLFVRMQRTNPESVYLLDVQYRMHPQISKFPSAQFYKSKLTDGPHMMEKNNRPWHADFPLSPYRFFDIGGRHQQNVQTKSFFNPLEAKVALELVEKLMQILPQDKFRGRIGIISPYKEQIRTLKDTFVRKYGNLILNEIDFNTVDGFQGQEKEIIIMSCVRASESGSVGFLSDVRRMNVALTRARTTLWILGNKQSLRRDKIWSKLIADAESRDCVTLAEPGFLKRIFKTGQPSKSAFNANGSLELPETVMDRKRKSSSVDVASTEGTHKLSKLDTSNSGNSAVGNQVPTTLPETSHAKNTVDISSAKQNLSPTLKKSHEKKRVPYIYNAKLQSALTSNNDTNRGSASNSRPSEKIASTETKDSPFTQSSNRQTPNTTTNKTSSSNASGINPTKSGVYMPPQGPRKRGSSSSIFIKRKRPT